MAIASGGAQALGLGSIQLNSSLNQPLSADIEVVSDSADEAEGLVAKLASQEAFILAGIDRPFELTNLDFELRQSDDGRTVIHVTSPEPISEPFLNFLVEVGWARGSLVREYTVLLDPPVFLAEQSADAAVSETETGVADDPSLPQRIEREGNDVLSADELEAELAAVNAVIEAEGAADSSEPTANVSDLIIAPEEPTVTPTVTTDVAQAPAEADSGSTRGSGSVLDDIDSVVAELDRLFEQAGLETSLEPAPVVVAADDGSVADAAAADAAAVPVGTPEAGGQIGPVRGGQTLWSLAKANRQGNATIEQTMLALLRDNPAAFDGENVNALRRGAILRMPDRSDVASVDVAQARQLVRSQNAAWRALRGDSTDPITTARIEEPAAQEAATQEVAPVSDVADADVEIAETASSAGAVVDSQTQAEESAPAPAENLSIVAAQPEDGAVGGSDDSAVAEQVDALEQQLAVALEDVESERQNAAELQSRVLELETAVDKMNRLLEVRNAELERLQNAGESATDSVETTDAEMAALRAELDAANETLQALVESGDARQAEAQARIDALQADLDAARSTGAESAESAQAELTQAVETAAADAAAADAAAADAAAADAAAEAAREAQAQARAEAEAEAARLLEQQAAADAAQPWYAPLLNPRNAAVMGAIFAGLLFLWFLLARRRKGAVSEEELFAEVEGSPEAMPADAFADSIPEDDGSVAEELVDDATSDATVAADSLGSGVAAVAATAAGAVGMAAVAQDQDDDPTQIIDDEPETETAEPHADVLAEADVYLSYGLADRAEELLDDAIDKNGDVEPLHNKRLEALFAKQDGTTFAARAETYKDTFGDKTEGWSSIAGWGAALAPSSALFAGAAAASLGDEDDVLEATEVVEVVDEGGLVSQLGDDLSETVQDVGDGLSSEIDDALELPDGALDFSNEALDFPDSTLEEAAGGLGELDEIDALDRTMDEPDLDAALDDPAGTLVNTVVDPVADIAAGGELDATAVVSGLEGAVDPLDSTAELTFASDDLSGYAAAAPLDDLSLPSLDDLDATNADGTLVDGNLTGEFERSLEGTNADGVELGDQTLDMEQLEAELLETDLSGSVGGLADDLDFDAAGLSIVGDDDPADMTATGDEVDTMLDLARAYIDMGDFDSAGSTLKEVVASGNASQVETAKALQKQFA